MHGKRATSTGEEDEEEIIEVVTHPRGLSPSQATASTASSSPSTVPILARDSVCESYRSIVEVINRTSEGFKEGKKWKCVSETIDVDVVENFNSSQKKHRQRSSRAGAAKSRRYLQSLSQSHTMDNKQPISHAFKGRRLVRQKATQDDVGVSEELCLLTTIEIDGTSFSQRQRPGLPPKQWTVDTCAGFRQQQQQQDSGPSSGQGSTAYLLRPVSRTSVVSPTTMLADSSKRHSSSDQGVVGLPLKSPVGGASKSPFNTTSFSQQRQLQPQQQSMDMGSLKRTTDSVISQAQKQQRLLKQRTSESAPQANYILGGSSKCLPRQHSNASAYSATVTRVGLGGTLTQSHSHQGITLVRGASCSLVDIPTYLNAPGGVELAQSFDLRKSTTTSIPPIVSNAANIGAASDTDIEKQPLRTNSYTKEVRPRLQLDLRRKDKIKEARKTQWTVLCVSLTLLTLSVTLVGTMLSVGSKYQERVIAKHWDTIKNQTLSKMMTEEPFVIFPENFGEEELGGSGNETVTDGFDYESSSSNSSEETIFIGGEEIPMVPIIFPSLMVDTKELLQLSRPHELKKEPSLV